MKNVKFYVCPTCGNILFSVGNANISCCDRKLTALAVEAENENHVMTVAEIKGDYYVTIDHEMTKTHYISFVAFVGYDRILLIKMYPEQDAALRFPKMHGNKLYACCNEHGLWEKKII